MSDPIGKYPFKSFNNRKDLPKYRGEVAEDGKMTSTRMYTKSTAPGSTNDGFDSAGISQVFEVGDFWYCTTTNCVYRCTDNTQSAAVWVQGALDAEENVLYVGKHGNDSNGGSNIGDAFLTFGAAITAASALSPSVTNRIAILCLDAGSYTEDIAVPSWVGVIATAALITGNHTVTDNSLLESFRLVSTSGTSITKSTGNGSATVVCPRMILTGSASGAICTSGTINYSGETLSVQDGFGIGSSSTSVVHVHISSIEITGTGIGAGISSSGRLVITSNDICDDGSGTALSVASTGTVNATVSEIDCNTAYNVSAAGATLNLFCSSLTGTKTNSGTANHISTDNGGSVTGSFQFGDIANGNYFQIESDGTKVLNGDSTCFTDFSVPLTRDKQGQSSKPDYDFTNLGLLFPQNDATEIVYLTFQMDHRKKMDSDITFHIHYIQSEATQPTFKIDYRFYLNGAAVPGAFTTLSTADGDKGIFSYTSGSILQIATFTAITPPANETISANLDVKLYRDDNDVTGDILTKYIDFHYEMDTDGSRSAYSK
jgi:hypothetical protein